MPIKARHLLVEYTGCDPAVLDDVDAIEASLRRAAAAAEVGIVGHCFHQFTPQGVSGTLLIEESHLSIHTWPERAYAAVDFYTCGNADPMRAHEVLRKELQAKDFEVMLLRRTGDTDQASIEVVDPASTPD